MNQYIIDGTIALSDEYAVRHYAKVNGLSGKDVEDLLTLWSQSQVVEEAPIQSPKTGE